MLNMTLLHECIHFRLSPFPAGEDFVATPYIVMFSDFNSQQSLSSSADVVIINDTMAEFTESFKCVISAPDGEDTRGIVIADPNTVTIAIQDNDGEWVWQGFWLINVRNDELAHYSVSTPCE